MCSQEALRKTLQNMSPKEIREANLPKREVYNGQRELPEFDYQAWKSQMGRGGYRRPTAQEILDRYRR